jgi:hypothetical protein
MPCAVDWSPERRLVICHVGGRVSGDAVCDAIDEVATRLQGENGAVNVCWDAQGRIANGESNGARSHRAAHEPVY